jgi:hypothetical protein
VIITYEGKNGSGKSYGSTAEIVNVLLRGNWVYTNSKVYPDKIEKYCRDAYGVTFPDGMPLRYFENGFDLIKAIVHEMPRGRRGSCSLALLDEAQLFLNSRNWKTTHTLLQEFITYLPQHRKQHHDLIFIAPNFTDIDKQIRDLSQFVVRWRDMQRLELPFFGSVCPWPYSLMIKVDYDGKTIMGRKVAKRDPKIFELYESEALLIDNAFSNLSEIKPVKVDRQKEMSILLHRLQLPAIGVSVLLYLLTWYLT